MKDENGTDLLKILPSFMLSILTTPHSSAHCRGFESPVRKVLLLLFCFFSPLPVQTPLRCPYSPYVQWHASTPVRTLTIPNTGSHTIVWTQEKKKKIYIFPKSEESPAARSGCDPCRHFVVDSWSSTTLPSSVADHAAKYF